MSAAVFQVLAALITAGVGAFATVVALSPSSARIKRLERLIALRKDAAGTPAERNLELAISRATEEVLVDAEVNLQDVGWRRVALPVVVTAAILTVITVGLLAEPGEVQRLLIVSGAGGIYMVSIVAVALHRLGAQIRRGKHEEMFGEPQSPNLRADEQDELAAAEEVVGEAGAALESDI